MTPAERTDHILRMMLRGEWKGGRSRKELAAEWKLHERTIGDDAMVASGVLARRGKPIEDLIDSKIAELEQIQHQAMERQGYTIGGDAYPNPDLRNAILAIRLIMDIRGATKISRGRNDHKPPPVDDEYAKLTKAERVARLQEALAVELAGEDGSNGMH